MEPPRNTDADFKTIVTTSVTVGGSVTNEAIMERLVSMEMRMNDQHAHLANAIKQLTDVVVGAKTTAQIHRTLYEEGN